MQHDKVVAAAAAALGAWDHAAALAAVAGALGARPGSLDLGLIARDPRQDMQYGEQLVLARDPRSWKAAAKLLARARRTLPRDPSVHALSGAASAVVGRFAEAETHCARAIALDPECAAAWAWRGVAKALAYREHKTQKGLDGALADLDQAAGFEGAAALFALPWRAELRHDLEDASGALEDLDRVLEAEPSNAWARVERGEILCESGNAQEALVEFDRLVKENPKAPWAWSLRGRTLATSGREAEGRRDLEKAVRLSPRSAAPRAWLSEALRKLGRYAEAGRQLDAAIRLDPKFALAWLWRGRLSLALGRPEAALKDLERAVRLDERYILAIAWRGEAKFKLGRYQQAADDFRRVAPLDLRRIWNVVLREGETATKEQREKAYWDDLSRAVQRRPKDRWARGMWEGALSRIPGRSPVREQELAAA